MSEQAQRQMDLEAAIELEKKKAEIEIAKEQRLQQLRQQQPPTNVAENNDAMQERLLEQAHPQWKRIVLSSAFHKWLATRQADFAKACRTTREAAVLSFCIDEFFGPPAVR